MIFLALLIGLIAAAVLLFAGYQIGISVGTKEREQLRQELEQRSGEYRSQVQVLGKSLQQQEAMQQTLENDMRRYVSWISQGQANTEQMRTELSSMLKPLMERGRADDDLRNSMQQLLEPLMQREQLGQNLAEIDLGTGQREELPRLLDNIATTGGFSVVLLSDEAGLPLAASSGTDNPERYAGLASLLMLLIERLAREPGPEPLAIVVHNEANEQMLSRVFEASGQKLMLTAVSASSSMSPMALDPALTKLQTVLGPARTLG